MVLTIEVTSELESQVREQAEQRGLGTGEYIVNILQEYVRQTPKHDVRCLSEVEARLLQKINEGFSPERWHQYNALLVKRRAETLTPDEHAELIALSDQIEAMNAHRIEYLTELARLRQIALLELMQQLGIKALPYA